MTWVNFSDLPSGENEDEWDEEKQFLLDNILVPFLSGSKVLHIRSNEEQRIRGICKSLHIVNDEIRQLYIHSYAKTTSMTLEERKVVWVPVPLKGDMEAVHKAPGATDKSEHYRLLDTFIKEQEGGILLFVDADRILKGDIHFNRLLKMFAMGLEDDNTYSERPAKAVIIHTVEQETPASLARDISFVDLPLPKDSTLKRCIEGACQYPMIDVTVPDDDDLVSSWVRALRGLTSSEAKQALVQTLMVHDKKFTPEALDYLSKRKRDYIEQTGIMEFSEPTLDFSDIGGLDELIKDLKSRRIEFEQKAKDAGIKSPKGCLLVGLPGTGKSRIGKAVAGEWKLPMLQFNMANVLGSYVGESEKGMRNVLSVAESLAPCILFVDEIDKALSGLGGGGDSGVTKRVIGSFLTWLNDREAEVYVIATANDLSEITNAMPEMLRKGRWDETWWVDLPGEKTRGKIIEIHLDMIPRERIEEDVYSKIPELAKLNSGCSGAELASAVNESNRRAFHDGERNISYSDIKNKIEGIHPLASGISTLTDSRRWMRENAKFASSEEPPDISKTSTLIIKGEHNSGFEKPE